MYELHLVTLRKRVYLSDVLEKTCINMNTGIETEHDQEGLPGELLPRLMFWSILLGSQGLVGQPVAFSAGWSSCPEPWTL